jgi:phosphate transport system permease protein
MTLVAEQPSSVAEMPTGGHARSDVPRRLRTVTRQSIAELGLSAVAAACLVGVVFALFGLGTNAWMGFVICWAAAFVVNYGVASAKLHGILVAKDRLARMWVAAGAAIALGVLAWILIYVLVNGWYAAFGHEFPSFWTHDFSRGGVLDKKARVGALHAVAGTLEQVGLATLVTTPLAVLAAVYLNEMPGRLAMVLRVVVDAMSGMPSIIAGLFIYIIWVVPRGQNGFSGVAAAMAISIIMMPTVIRTSEEVLRLVPGTLREAALALGSPERRMVLKVVLPTARAGLVTAVILGIARATGETAPVLLTSGGTPRLNLNPFSGAQADLPEQVYSWYGTAGPTSLHEAWGGALVLILVVLTLFVLARLLGSGRRVRPNQRSLRHALVARVAERGHDKISVEDGKAAPGARR